MSDSKSKSNINPPIWMIEREIELREKVKFFLSLLLKILFFNI